MAEIAVQGITVKVDAAPGGVAAGSPASVGVLTNIDGLEKTRATKKYPAINSDEQPSITGRLELAPVVMTVLYNPDASNGENKLEAAIDGNEQVSISIELNNSGGINGTTYTALYYVSSFKKVFEADGVITAEITAEINGSVTELAAA